MSVIRASLQIAATYRRIILPVNNVLLRSLVFLKARNTRRFLLVPATACLIRATAVPLEQMDATTSLSYLIHHADHLYEGNKFVELYDLLYPYKESDQVELLWRFARSSYSLAQLSKTVKEKKLELLAEGYLAVKRALDLDTKSAPAYKWMSILLDTYSASQGFTERCKQIVEVKDLMTTSVQLDPTDATVLYMLGVWFYEIADLPWYQRQVLNAVGGVKPQATFEEALEFFEKAENTDPEFYSLNLLMLGKTYLKLGNIEKAFIYLKKAAEYPDLNEDDRRARKEAAALLEKLGPKE